MDWTKGRLLLNHKRADEAYPALSSAAHAPKDDWKMPHERFDAISHTAAAATTIGAFEEANEFAKAGLQLGLDSEYFDEVGGLELLGELAWNYWVSGERTKACGAFYGLLTRLARSSAAVPRLNEATWKTGHVMGWLSAMATTGKPPPRTANDEKYVEPFHGFLLKSMPLASTGLPAGIAALYFQLGLLCNEAGCYRLARRAFSDSSTAAMGDGNDVLASFSDTYLAPLQLFFGEQDLAMKSTIRVARLHDLTNAQRDSGSQEDYLTGKSDLDALWQQLEDNQKHNMEKPSVFRSFLWPAFIRVASNSDQEENTAFLDAIKARLLSASELEDPQYWISLVELVENSLAGTLRRVEINALIEERDKEDSQILGTLYFVLALALDAKPTDSLGAQAWLLTYGEEAVWFADLVGPHLTQWMCSYWRAESEERSFRLNHPQFLREEPLLKKEQPSVSEAARILVSASAACNARLPEWLSQKLQKLAEMPTGLGPTSHS